MHASLITSPLPAEHVEQATASIKENASNLKNAPGFQGGYWTYDHDNNTMTAVVVFETQEQADAAWQRMGPVVTESAQALGGALERHSCEVIHHL